MAQPFTDSVVQNHPILTLFHDAQRDRQRRCVVISGTWDWVHDQAAQLTTLFDQQNHDKPIWISKNPPANVISYDPSKTHSLLGQEIPHLIFDAFSGFNPESFGATSGCLRAGGLLILLCPDLDAWPSFADPEHRRLAVYPHDEKDISGRYLSRLVRVLKADQHLLLHRQSDHAAVSNNNHTTLPDPTPPSSEILPTADQTTAIKAIKKVAQGRRRRPLVITADRGRGKSAALGMAAAELIDSGSKKIIVTAPHSSAATVLFEHAQRSTLTTLDQALIFLPPDALCLSQPDCDLLIIDEAAAIPTPLLEKCLRRYSRIVFASTIHGYEGTGRGFAIRFKQKLEQITPSWGSLNMVEPIRWANNDPVEALTFRLLLLNADTPAIANLPRPTKIFSPATIQTTLTCLDRDQLWQDENRLNALFGLLVNAHYQTKPNDLRQLLDGPNLSVFVLQAEKIVIGAVLLAREGQLDEPIINAIAQGKRRPQGHLIPETLIIHSGLNEFAQLAGGRIVRIAIHPDFQQAGFGQHLLTQLKRHPATSDLDYLAASFGANLDLLNFWSKADYQTIRIGTQRNASSGEYSALMVHALSVTTSTLLRRAREQMQQQLPHQLAEPLATMEPDLAFALLSTSTTDLLPQAMLDQHIWQDVSAFAQQQRPYESCLASLWHWSLHMLRDQHCANLLNTTERNVLINKVLQRLNWKTVAEQNSLTGKKDVVKLLQKIVEKTAQIKIK